MDDLLTFYLPLIVAAIGFLDALAGYLPDKWVNYIGVVRRVFDLLRRASKQGPPTAVLLVLLMSAVLMAGGCSGIGLSLTSPAQQQIVDLTVRIAAKAIGIKLARDGFEWTDEIEAFYRMIEVQDQISLDAAQLAERYIHAHVDPLIAPDLMELAGMVGFEFDAQGMVSGVGGVDAGLLKIAAAGFRAAILARAALIPLRAPSAA